MHMPDGGRRVVLAGVLLAFLSPALMAFAASSTRDSGHVFVAASDSIAGLVATARVVNGKPADVNGAIISIPSLHLGAQFENGRARLSRIRPGTRLVRWSTVGAFGDSARITFVPGRAESLSATFTFEGPERWGVGLATQPPHSAHRPVRQKKAVPAKPTPWPRP